MMTALDQNTRNIGLKKLKKILNFYEGKYIRNEDTKHDIELISTSSSYAINPDKYIAITLNRVDAFQNFAKDYNLKQLFVTLTLPSAYHRYVNIKGKTVKNKAFAHGDLELYDIYTKTKADFFTRLIIKYYKTKKKKKWTGKIENISLKENDYSVESGYKQLINMFSKVRKDRAWMAIEKEKRLFFSVIEPTKNLTAHIHISLWVPENAISRLIKVFFRFYPHPLTHIYTHTIPLEFEKEPGLQKSDKDIVDYGLKYLNNLEENGEITEQSLWYLANKITPFSFSRILIPNDIYQKLGGHNTLHDATKKYRCSAIYAWSSAEHKKLMKVFNGNTITWTKSICTMREDLHPVGSSNSDKKESLWEQ